MTTSEEKWMWVLRSGIGVTLLAGLLFFIGFATNYWSNKSNINFGLWEICSGPTCTALSSDMPDYHKATQALQIIAIVLYVLSPIIQFFVYCGVKEKSSGVKSRIFDIGFSIGVLFHFISVLIFGLKLPDSGFLSWSFNMSAASTALAALGIFLVILSRKPALRNFGFFSDKERAKRNGRVGSVQNSSTSGSRSQTPQQNLTSRSQNVFGPSERTAAQHRLNPSARPFATGTSAVAMSYPPSGQSQATLYPPPGPPQAAAYPYDLRHPPFYQQDYHPQAGPSTALGPIRGSGPSAPPPESPPSYEESIYNR
ncbi:unnamed protein product [Lymnaea stagnalis]|uniref:Uncharacterized protein n=1 Tax=Lymnaea stagnalis TaxID=6523 RepID=A0AAV2H1G7_LYMST